MQPECYITRARDWKSGALLHGAVTRLKDILGHKCFMRRIRRSRDFASNVQSLWRYPSAARDAATAVSLHSHTMHSKESLDFIPRVLAKIPAIAHRVHRISERRRAASGHGIAFERGFWRPPLHAQAAWELEAGQIRNTLRLEPLVSITDHDDLEACADLQAIGIPAPYSLEWTVPYGPTIFHIGVHNLPAEQARGFAAEMARYTVAPEPHLLATLLAELDALPDVLVVLNHPFCCELRVDRAGHIPWLRQFLQQHLSRLHALELNGLQPASDNREVIRLAEENGIPTVSGGDRHCLEPNANVNLTNATTFAEFVNEVRRERLSRVLFLPQYREPIAARYIEFIWHAARNYPELPGRKRWVDRIFYDHERDGVVPLAAFWPEGGPWALRYFIAAVGFLATPHMRATLRLAFGEQGQVGA